MGKSLKRWINGRQKTSTNDCEQSRFTKRDDDMTTSNHAQDTTAGGGRGIFSNTHGDVLMSIFATTAHGKHGTQQRQRTKRKKQQQE